MKKALSVMLTLLLVVMAAIMPASAEVIELDHLDYADAENWSYWAEGSEQPADLFIVAPTVDMGKKGNLLADMTYEKYKTNFTGALNMELGIYTDVCTVYAPYYQQATFPVYSMEAEEAEPYFDFAYEDVRAAFLYYLENCDSSRPLVLAGFSQGADLAIRLTEEFFADEALAARLVAVYAIGWRVTEEDIQQYSHLKMAQGSDDTGVIICFNSEAEHITSSTLVPEGVKTYAINPLNWTTDGTPADNSLNLGACFTDYSGVVTKEIPNFCGGYLDDVRGVLKVPEVDEEEYPANIFDNGIFHIYDYQFFYRNLQANVSERVEAFLK